MALTVDIEKTLGNFHLQVAFEAEKGVLALLGASGCGKSMTLKCIAGIETPDRGRIVLDGQVLFDSENHINLTPQKRKVGYLFQQYALFPNMTVLQNLKAGCRGEQSRLAKIPEMLKMIHMEGMENKRPSQLSGGQQQRVALARILLNEPEVLLLDEPFSALDSHLRFTMEQELQDTIARFGRPAILVSHNRDEVFRLSDWIAVMDAGEIQCLDSKAAVFADPVTRAGAVLTGCKNTAPVKKLSDGQYEVPAWGMTLHVAKEKPDCGYIGIRMHDIMYGEGENSFYMKVVRVIENPFSFTIMMRPVDHPEAEPVGWETDKDVWRRVESAELRMHFPAEALMLLK